MYNFDHEESYGSFSFNGNYRGEVVDNADPKEAGRCRIRVYGVYGDDVPDDCLPWAEFADPFMQGAAGTGGFWVPEVGMKVWVFFETGDHMQPVYFAGAPALNHLPNEKTDEDEQTSRGGVEYTKNRIVRTPAGHMIEMDDTPGNSRVRVVHRSGTQTIMYDNGDMYNQVMGNFKMVVNGDFEEIVNGEKKTTTIGDAISIVNGDQTHTVNGDSQVSVIGDSKMVVNGDSDIQSTGNMTLWATGMMDIRGATTNINLAPATVQPATPAVAEEFDEFIPPDSYQTSPENAAALINSAGSKAAFDEEGETIPDGWPKEESKEGVAKPTEVQTEDGSAEPVSADCEQITKVDYTYKLSPNFTLRSVSLGAVFPHSIRAQGGLSVSEIVCNLKHLCVNILEPLKKQFPNIRINSGFRIGSGGSQHNKGQAVDIQVPGAKASVYSDMAAWIVKNLPYDQFILEHGKSVWLHISYNKNGGRKMRGTYYPKRSPVYQWGVLKNYYDNGRVIK